MEMLFPLNAGFSIHGVESQIDNTWKMLLYLETKASQAVGWLTLTNATFLMLLLLLHVH